MTDPFIDAAWTNRARQAFAATFDLNVETKNGFVRFLMDEGFWDQSRLSFESATNRFNACLNANKGEHLKIGEAWALMKRFGNHTLFLAMAEDLGYEVRRRPSAERLQQLLELTGAALAEIDSLRGQIARLRQEGAFTAAAPLGGPGGFSKPDLPDF